MIPEINFEKLLERSAKELKKAKKTLVKAGKNLSQSAKLAADKAVKIKFAICDEIRGMDASVAAVLASVNGEKIVFTATCGKDVVARGIKAGDMVRETAKTAGGNGGGKPDFAMAGGNDVSKLDAALSAAREFVAAKA